MGIVLLEGGAEFGGRMSEPDLCAIRLAGGFDAPIRIIPAAAAPDNNHVRAGNNGVRWFKSLGATDVEVVFAIDRLSANEAANASALRAARFIYLLGGFPHHLGETLLNSRGWEAALEAYEAGAVIGGSSAGAMVLCGHYYDPYEHKVLPGLDLIPNACVLPHHNTAGKRWAAMLSEQMPGSLLIGIDEATGMLLEAGEWAVYGGGDVTLYQKPGTAASTPQVYKPGDSFQI